MPLFNKLKDTSLKSLKYGNGFGNKNYSEPIITIPIGDNPLGIDYPISEAAKANGYRVSYLLNELPRGDQFKNNQTILNQHNAPLESLTGGPRFNPLYIAQNTITQAENPNIGFHFPRNFGDGTRDYDYIVKENNQSGYNRLERLYNKFEVGNQKQSSNYQFRQNIFETLYDLGDTLGLSEIYAGFQAGGELIGNFTDTSNTNRARKGLPPRPGLNKLNDWFDKAQSNVNDFISTVSSVTSYFPLGSGEVDTYRNGPSGGTETYIPRTVYTNDLKKRNEILEFGYFKLQDKPNILNYQNLRISTLFEISGDRTANLGLDYSSNKEINNSIYTKTTPSSRPGDVGVFDIVKKNKETSEKERTEFDKNSYTYKSSPRKNIRSSTTTSNIFWDRLGKLNAYEDKNNPITGQLGIDDRMPIIFKAIDPFTGEITDKDALSFSAYLSNFNDNYNPTWNAISYIGRSEDFYVYNKFSRTVSFNLQIPCFNQIDLQNNHAKLAKLVSSTMGSYGESNRLGGIIHKLTLGRYLQDQAGVLSNVSYNIDNNSAWDVDQGFAHNINVSITFTVIHNFLPTYTNASELFNVTERFYGDISIKSLKSKDPKQIVTDLEKNAEEYVRNLVKPLINQLGPLAPTFKKAEEKIKNWGIFKRGKI